MGATDNEVRIYRGTVDPRPGNATRVEVEGLDGTHPLINHTDTEFAWGYRGAGPSTLAQCIVIDTLGTDARCKRCVGGGIDPESQHFLTELDAFLTRHLRRSSKRTRPEMPRMESARLT
jgi:hypothetical protein